MKKLIFTLFLYPFLLNGQVAKDYAILLTATVQENPPKIQLNWPSATASSYFVYKKLKSDVTYGAALTTLAGTSTGFTDSDVSVGESYEYYIKKNGGNATAYGYINCGILVDPENNGTGSKGKLVLLIDSAASAALTTEIDLLIQDMEGEGWTVFRHDVSPKASVPDVKQLIQKDYNTDPSNFQAVFILGHVPVPYSGNINPDAHTNHIGAWPADAYFGDMNGIWSDAGVNNTSASDVRNHNVPGDGKFDPSMMPSDIELQVGRVDLSDMPAFAKSEMELLRQYLAKNHAFRTNEIKLERRALIDDNFGGFNTEAFAASGWKAFSTFFGADSIKSNVGTSYDYRTDLSKNSYLWSYGCGAGSYTSCSGIGNTSQLAGDSLQTAFTMLFGSYFGDWDKTNNILRAPLAQGLTLTNVWSGRPHWYFHHMALGDNIGYSQRLMVNVNPYSQHYAAQFVHIALMGDPTLRMYAVSPPSNLQLSEVSNQVQLTWTASTDAVLGYDIYRKDSLHGVYKKVNSDLVTGTSYTDVDFDFPSAYGYSVRAVKLESSASGTFYYLSTGAIGTIETIYTGMDRLHQEMNLTVSPNPSSGSFVLTGNGVSSGEYRLSVYSASNHLVEESRVLLEDNEGVNLHLDHLPSGMYFLSIRGKGQQAMKKLVIVKSR